MAFCALCGREVEKGQVCACAEGSSGVAGARQSQEVFKKTAYFVVDAIFAKFAKIARRINSFFRPAAATSMEEVKLSDDEFVIRKYKCSELKIPKCVGFLSVTNHRVIFHGHASASRVISEVPLDSVLGVSTFYGSRIVWILLLIGIGLLIGISDAETMGWKIGLFVVGAIFVILAFRSTFTLKIFSSASAAPISVGTGPKILGGENAAYAIVGDPTDDTDRMMIELGAMISDLQRMGDLGVKKWKG